MVMMTAAAGAVAAGPVPGLGTHGRSVSGAFLLPSHESTATTLLSVAHAWFDVSIFLKDQQLAGCVFL